LPWPGYSSKVKNQSLFQEISMVITWEKISLQPISVSQHKN
jgi:hypothetical protein